MCKIFKKTFLVRKNNLFVSISAVMPTWNQWLWWGGEVRGFVLFCSLKTYNKFHALWCSALWVKHIFLCFHYHNNLIKNCPSPQNFPLCCLLWSTPSSHRACGIYWFVFCSYDLGFPERILWSGKIVWFECDRETDSIYNVYSFGLLNFSLNVHITMP